MQLQNGASLSQAAVDGSIPFHYAASRGLTGIIYSLLDYSTSDFAITDQLNARDNENQTPLHRAAQKGCLEVIIEIH